MDGDIRGGDEGVSTVFFLLGSAVTTVWVQDAFSGAAAGVAVGSLLGVVGLAVTKWEPTPHTLHYTPNRFLVLFITFIVSARLLYGLYRSFLVAQAGVEGASVITAFGIPESLGAGGIVVGYYLAYGAGLRWRIKKWQRRALRRDVRTGEDSESTSLSKRTFGVSRELRAPPVRERPGGSRRSWKLPLPRATRFTVTFGAPLLVLRHASVFNHRLFEQARDLTAVCALQCQVALFVAGSQLITVAE